MNFEPRECKLEDVCVCGEYRYQHEFTILQRFVLLWQQAKDKCCYCKCDKFVLKIKGVMSK